jgi:hypothetical protein
MTGERPAGETPDLSDKLITAMLGVVVDNAVPGLKVAADAGLTFETTLRHGETWLHDDADPRGIVLREYAKRLGALIARVDARSEGGAA